MKSIKIELYNTEVKLFASKKEMDRWLKKNCAQDVQEYLGHIGDYSDGMAGYLFTENDEHFYYIMLESMDLVTLCHESLHIAYMVLDAVNITHTIDNHESLTYLTHHVFEKAGKAFGLLGGSV